MHTWQEFSASRPDLAKAGKRLLYQYSVGYAFLATVRKDGGPRLHPVCPALTAGHLYVFIESASPKLADLLRDRRYALHTFPPKLGDEEFYCAGQAEPVDDPQQRASVVASYHRHPHADERLFELKLERILHTTWENWATPASRPHRTVWRAVGAQARSSRPRPRPASAPPKVASTRSGRKSRKRTTG